MSNENKYGYFQFSQEQLTLKKEHEKKVGKQYFPGTVVIRGKSHVFTEITNTDTSKYSDAKLLTQGYLKDIIYTKPYSK